MDLGLPLVVAVNLVDLAGKRGLAIDFRELERRLGIPVVPIQANRGIGLDSLKAAIGRAAEAGSAPTGVPFPDAFRREAAALGEVLGGEVEPFLLDRVLLDVGGYTEKQLAGRFGAAVSAHVAEARLRLAAVGCPVPAIEARTRYAWIRQAAAGVSEPGERASHLGRPAARPGLHKLWGTLIFLAHVPRLEAIFVGAKPLWISSTPAGNCCLMA